MRDFGFKEFLALQRLGVFWGFVGSESSALTAGTCLARLPGTTEHRFEQEPGGGPMVSNLTEGFGDMRAPLSRNTISEATIISTTETPAVTRR